MFVRGTIVPRGPSERCLCVSCFLETLSQKPSSKVGLGDSGQSSLDVAQQYVFTGKESLLTCSFSLGYFYTPLKPRFALHLVNLVVLESLNVDSCCPPTCPVVNKLLRSYPVKLTESH